MQWKTKVKQRKQHTFWIYFTARRERDKGWYVTTEVDRIHNQCYSHERLFCPRRVLWRCWLGDRKRIRHVKTSRLKTPCFRRGKPANPVRGSSWKRAAISMSVYMCVYDGCFWPSTTTGFSAMFIQNACYTAVRKTLMTRWRNKVNPSQNTPD